MLSCKIVRIYYVYDCCISSCKKKVWEYGLLDFGMKLCTATKVSRSPSKDFKKCSPTHQEVLSKT